MNEEKILTLQLNINEINIILAGLGKLPLEASLNLFNTIHKQVNDQADKKPEGPLSDKIVK
jgi:hypothetical protein